MAPSPVCLLLNLAGVVKIGGPCAAFDWYDIYSGIAPYLAATNLLVVPILRCVLMLFWEMLQLSNEWGKQVSLGLSLSRR